MSTLTRSWSGAQHEPDSDGDVNLVSGVTVGLVGATEAQVGHVFAALCETHAARPIPGLYIRNPSGIKSGRNCRKQPCSMRRAQSPP